MLKEIVYMKALCKSKYYEDVISLLSGDISD